MRASLQQCPARGSGEGAVRVARLVFRERDWDKSGRAFIVVDGNEDKRLSVKLFPSPVFPDNLPNAFNFMISRGKTTRRQPRRGDSFVF